MTDDQLTRAAQMLYGLADAAEARDQHMVLVPTATARQLADALVALLSRPRPRG
jgi:hypothetical protein